MAKPNKKERTTSGRIDAGGTSTDADLPDECDTPDLDARDRRQTGRRKAYGPGAPARPAPRPSRDGRDEEEPEPWGTDPTSMPPAEPT
jgi:hypothetical protein